MWNKPFKEYSLPFSLSMPSYHVLPVVSVQVTVQSSPPWLIGVDEFRCDFLCLLWDIIYFIFSAAFVNPLLFFLIIGICLLRYLISVLFR